MTKNRKNKRAVRDLAARQQVNYTAAGRAAGLLTPTGPEAVGHTWLTGVPVLITADQVAAMLPERLADRLVEVFEATQAGEEATVVVLGRGRRVLGDGGRRQAGRDEDREGESGEEGAVHRSLAKTGWQGTFARGGHCALVPRLVRRGWVRAYVEGRRLRRAGGKSRASSAACGWSRVDGADRDQGTP